MVTLSIISNVHGFFGSIQEKNQHAEIYSELAINFRNLSTFSLVSMSRRIILSEVVEQKSNKKI